MDSYEPVVVSVTTGLLTGRLRPVALFSSCDVAPRLSALGNDFPPLSFYCLRMQVFEGVVLAKHRTIAALWGL